MPVTRLEVAMAATAPSSGTDFFALIGDLYTRWTLDGLTEIAYAIATDFIVRPQLYQADDIPDAILNLRTTYGTSANFPNLIQRQAIMAPILGRSDGLKPDASNTTASFHMARKKLHDAAIAFSERAVDTGIAMLEDRIRSALVPLRSHFDGLRGKSLQLSAGQITSESNTAIDVLTSAGIARVFSVTSPDKSWPLSSNDPNGAKLVETAGAALPLSADYKMSYTKFILLQRVALEGGRALTTALRVDPASQNLQDLISQLYTWATSLRDYQQAA
jgi:hypothetical protein